MGYLGFDSWFEIPGFGFLPFDSWFGIAGSGYLAQGYWLWIRRIRILALDFWNRIPDFGFLALGSRIGIVALTPSLSIISSGFLSAVPAFGLLILCNLHLM